MCRYVLLMLSHINFHWNNDFATTANQMTLKLSSIETEFLLLLCSSHQIYSISDQLFLLNLCLIQWNVSTSKHPDVRLFIWNGSNINPQAFWGNFSPFLFKVSSLVIYYLYVYVYKPNLVLILCNHRNLASDEVKNVSRTTFGINRMALKSFGTL